jgi:hypothetical protein
MEYIDLIIKIAGAITATGVILGVVIKLWKAANRLKSTADSLSKTLNDLKEHSDENYMSLLRLTIMSNEMPIGERINAGYKYLNKGGNGEVKKYLKEVFNITDTVETAPHYKE